MYKYLLIDCDDTVLDFQSSERCSIAIVMKNHGIDPTVELIEEYVKINEAFWHQYEKGEISRERLLELRFIQFFQKYNIAVDGAKVNQEYLETLSNNVYVINGIYDVLAYFKHKGYKLYMITNGVKKTQEKRWHQTDVYKYFDGFYISEDIGYHKPQKEYFDYVINDIGDFTLNNYLVIGNSIASDIKGAINYGLDVIWYNPRRIKSDVKVREINDISEYYKLL